MTSKEGVVRVCLLLIVLLGVIAFKTFPQPAAVHGAAPVEYKVVDLKSATDVGPLNELGKQGWHVVAVTQSGMACCFAYMEK